MTLIVLHFSTPCDPLCSARTRSSNKARDRSTHLPRRYGHETLHEKIDQGTHARRERPVGQIDKVDGALRHEPKLAQQRYELSSLQVVAHHVERQEAYTHPGSDSRTHHIHFIGFEDASDSDRIFPRASPQSPYAFRRHRRKQDAVVLVQVVDPARRSVPLEV